MTQLALSPLSSLGTKHILIRFKELRSVFLFPLSYYIEFFPFLSLVITSLLILILYLYVLSFLFPLLCLLFC